MIVIPMAGLSRRFSEAGYSRPKYELKAHGRTLFFWSVWSFRHYFADERFVFVARADAQARDFIAAQCAELGIRDHTVVELGGATRGQAETVFLGLESACPSGGDAALLIFNIDTIRPDYRFPNHLQFCDGYLETFPGEGNAWSFAEPAAAFSTRVRRTSEKVRISNDCSTGLYYFASVSLYRDTYLRCVQSDEYLRTWKELYIAPLYNDLIDNGRAVHMHRIGADEVIFSGVPAEYDAVRAECSPLAAFLPSL